jgi:thiamine biosynthesis lipoprotein
MRRFSGSQVALWAVGFALTCLVLAAPAQQPTPVRMSGAIFGTNWSLVYPVEPGQPAPERVRAALLEAFSRVDVSMNHYAPSSLISRFNRSDVDDSFEVDRDFAYVLTMALQISSLTEGAYDVTLSPLSGLWGFGPDGPTRWPQEEEIATARSKIGVDVLQWNPDLRQLSKQVAGAALDFSSIAKGYGVDLGADALDELAISSYLLDVGGEQRLKGFSPRGDAWRVAIERPDQMGDRVMVAVTIDEDTGIATSGNYRNFFEHEGQLYSHLIDPRTGYPIAHDVVSVTVIHPSTAIADAWATALIVLGGDRAIAVAEAQDLAVYLIRKTDRGYEVAYTSQMARWL